MPEGERKAPEEVTKREVTMKTEEELAPGEAETAPDTQAEEGRETRVEAMPAGAIEGRRKATAALINQYREATTSETLTDALRVDLLRSVLSEAESQMRDLRQDYQTLSRAVREGEASSEDLDALREVAMENRSLQSSAVGSILSHAEGLSDPMAAAVKEKGEMSKSAIKAGEEARELSTQERLASEQVQAEEQPGLFDKMKSMFLPGGKHGETIPDAAPVPDEDRTVPLRFASTEEDEVQDISAEVREMPEEPVEAAEEFIRTLRSLVEKGEDPKVVKEIIEEARVASDDLAEQYEAMKEADVKPIGAETDIANLSMELIEAVQLATDYVTSESHYPKAA